MPPLLRRSQSAALAGLPARAALLPVTAMA
jgi:hypothetical protein